MRADEFRFTRDHLGCWIDGSRGNQGTLDMLKNLMKSMWVTYKDIRAKNLAAEYHSDLHEEDHQIWVDKCTALLQFYTENGLVWQWEAGDLVLCTEDYIGSIDDNRLHGN